MRPYEQAGDAARQYSRGIFRRLLFILDPRPRSRLTVIPLDRVKLDLGKPIAQKSDGLGLPSPPLLSSSVPVMKRILFAAAALLSFSSSVFAHFHLMQVEQIIGGMLGDPTAQAIQLRMRAAGQNIVSEARVRVWDAAGENPVTVMNMGTNVGASASGSRVLLASPAFTTAMREMAPSFAPDFTMTSPIPAGYLAAGRLTFEGDDGIIYWSVSWGGSAYTGPQTGSTVNDANGNFGPAFPQALTSFGRQGILFQGSTSAFSVTNAADYALTSSTASVVRNDGTSFVINNDPAPTINDGFDPDANDEAYAVVVRPDGKILVGGKFTQISGVDASHLALLDAQGNPVSGFSTAANGDVKTLALQSDGKVLVGGYFTTLGGATRNCLARLNANGALDTSFNPNVPGGVEAIFVQPDGKILIGGDFTTVGGTSRNRLARLNADGTLDGAFDPNANGQVLAIALQADGAVLMGGFFSTVGGVSRNRLARLHPNGTVDSGFDPNPYGTVRAFAVQPDGKIVLGGAYTSIGITARNRLARVNPDGSLDAGFNPNANSAVFTTVLQPDGRILVGAQFTSVSSSTRNRIARLNADGTLDTGFNPNADQEVFGIALQPDHKILAVGRFTTMSGVSRNHVARLEADGSVETEELPLLDGLVMATAIQPDGATVVGGDFTTMDSVGRNRLARLTVNGSLDSTFNPNANDSVRAVALQPDGRVLVGGLFTTVGGQSRSRIARLNVDGTLDTAFDPGANGVVDVLAVQADGKILVGGGFTTIAGSACNRLARLNADGSLDSSFSPNVGNNEVFTIAVQPDGDIIIGGTFTNVGGSGRNFIARVNEDGTLDTAFNPDSGGTVRTVLLRPDGRILVGGAFTTMGGVTRNRLALLNASGSLASGFDPNANGTVYALAAQTDGTLLVGGAFTSISGTSRNRIARFHPGGVLDASFNPNANEAVYTLALRRDGKILVGGNFTTVQSGARAYLARITNLPATQSLSVDASGTAVTWLRGGSSPEVDRVEIETSLDQLSWTSHGDAERMANGSGWRLDYQTLPSAQNVFVRARGFQTQGGINGGDGALYESILQAYLAPEISVEEPTGIILVSGAAVTDFGSVKRGTIAARMYTIRNTGSVPLTGISAYLAVGDTGAYHIPAAPATSLAPGESSTFVVEFMPTDIGTKSVVLNIESNDSDENPFEINVTGAGVANPGTISIDMPASSFISVNEEAGSVNIPIVRVGTDGAASFTIAASSGNAAGEATLNVDYSSPDPAVRTFATGVGSMIVQVPILNAGPANEVNETFTVTLSAPTDGAVLGSVTTVTVRIIDATDSTPPAAPVISSPSAGVSLTLAANASVNLAGTATDNRGVRSVKVRLNGAAPVEALLSAPDAASTGWSLAVSPAQGLNTFTVQSFDTRGRASTLVTRSFTVLRTLTVGVSGAQYGSVTSGFAPTSDRVADRSYTIAATPKAPATGSNGGIFVGWTIGGADVARGGVALGNADASRIGVAATSLEKNSLTFIFREGMTLTANFVENPYPDLAGTYNGLIRAGGGVTTNATEGAFKAAVQSTGAFSGTLTIDGLTLNVAGAFDQQGDARFGTARLKTLVVARTGKPSLSVSLQLNTSDNATNLATPDKISGTVTSRAFAPGSVPVVSTVDADRAYYNGTSPPVDDAYLGPNKANGFYTVIFPPRDVSEQPPAFTVKDYPQGYGFATLTVTKAGLVTLSGTLADGTAITCSSALSQTDHFPLYGALYGKLGFISGFVQMDSTQAESDLAVIGDLRWLRPMQTSVQHYPAGWPEMIKVGLLGAWYRVTPGMSVMRAPDGGDGNKDGDPLQDPDADGNIHMFLTYGSLSEPLSKDGNLSSTDVLVKVPDNDPTFSLSVMRNNGALSGSFTHTDDTVPSLKGVVYQKGAMAGGYGYFLTVTPKSITYDGEGGSVEIQGDAP